MSDQRSNEAELSELVWAHNPATASPVKQMTRAKLQLLSHAYKEVTGDAFDGAGQPTPAEPAPRTRPAARRAGDSEQEEQS